MSGNVTADQHSTVPPGEPEIAAERHEGETVVVPASVLQAASCRLQYFPKRAEPLWFEDWRRSLVRNVISFVEAQDIYREPILEFPDTADLPTGSSGVGQTAPEEVVLLDRPRSPIAASRNSFSSSFSSVQEPPPEARGHDLSQRVSLSSSQRETSTSNFTATTNRHSHPVQNTNVIAARSSSCSSTTPQRGTTAYAGVASGNDEDDPARTRLRREREARVVTVDARRQLRARDRQSRHLQQDAQPGRAETTHHNRQSRSKTSNQSTTASEGPPTTAPRRPSAEPSVVRLFPRGAFPLQEILPTAKKLYGMRPPRGTYVIRREEQQLLFRKSSVSSSVPAQPLASEIHLHYARSYGVASKDLSVQLVEHRTDAAEESAAAWERTLTWTVAQENLDCTVLALMPTVQFFVTSIGKQLDSNTFTELHVKGDQKLSQLVVAMLLCHWSKQPMAVVATRIPELQKGIAPPERGRSLAIVLRIIKPLPVYPEPRVAAREWELQLCGAGPYRQLQLRCMDDKWVWRPRFGTAAKVLDKSGVHAFVSPGRRAVALFAPLLPPGLATALFEASYLVSALALAPEDVSVTELDLNSSIETQLRRLGLLADQHLDTPSDDGGTPVDERAAPSANFLILNSSASSRKPSEIVSGGSEAEKLAVIAQGSAKNVRKFLSRMLFGAL
ncbi:unnamed protein product [Amoebophrya sp. A120]|nr:unnamed protein product [Amoebophrya sp. A120]|eukprot:GSA120T00020768001.1